MHTASQALAIERQASAQPSLAERVSRPKTRSILGLMRLNFLSVGLMRLNFLSVHTVSTDMNRASIRKRAPMAHFGLLF
ncbi:MAG: hypothetical protein DI574_05605 [Acidovorax sp.]|nr:MAG: hypothetical protein DI574_05605 [Acidovorax sp.]